MKQNKISVIDTIIKWGTKILFVLSIVVLSYLSFVEKFEITPSIRNIATISLVGLLLNYLVWESYYKSNYEKILNADILNKEYCIHKRYYDARTGWKYEILQQKIREYNKTFVEAWIKDIESITARTETEIVAGKYKGNSHKWLIYRLKHKLYPKSGIKTPHDLLYILSVGKANSMKINTMRAEHYHTLNAIRKIFMSALGMILIASLTYEFIQGGYLEAVLKLVIQITMLFMSLFFGSISGINGGKMKLKVAEEISEMLEEWKNSVPEQKPYENVQNEVIVENTNKNDNLPKIEIV